MLYQSMKTDIYRKQNFIIISIDALLVYVDKYYLQAYLDNYDYKTVNEEMTDYLDENLFEE